MVASGQYNQQSPHFVHLLRSITGFNVLQDPVLPIALFAGFDNGVGGNFSRRLEPDCIYSTSKRFTPLPKGIGDFSIDTIPIYL